MNRFFITMIMLILIIILLNPLVYTDDYDIKQLKPTEDILQSVTDEVSSLSEQPIKKPVELYKDGDIIGVLTIEKIGLNLPIRENATQDNLNLGATHVLFTPYPWEQGNSFISAHRSWTYGELFNRLEELQIGDIIKVDSNEGIFIYTIYKIETVSPDNIEVFKQQEGEYNLTLTTCTPLYIATHRLIVYSKVV